MPVSDWVSQRVFRFVHGNNLVYNTCWEDPRLDRIALDIKPDDSVMVITSAGCNALDYALTGPKAVHAVDMNPRQNALLSLKLAAIKTLDYEDFFTLFGTGRTPNENVYPQLRTELDEGAGEYWDKWFSKFFAGRRPFYFRGTSGMVARMIKVYTDRFIRIRPHIEELLESDSLDQQREIYEQKIRDRFWSRSMRFFMNRDTTLSMLGVPKAQRKQVETQYNGGIVKFMEDCMESVFARLPVSDNYFWRVYVTGKYQPDCCPEYLKEENFEPLRNGIVDKIHVHTNSVQGFLEGHDEPISKFVLLDHMDWLSGHYFDLLESEWQAIVNRAAPNSRIIWRSGGLRTDFIDKVKVKMDGESTRVAEFLKYHEELAEELHQKDRVHTYGSFYIADLAA